MTRRLVEGNGEHYTKEGSDISHTIYEDLEGLIDTYDDGEISLLDLKLVVKNTLDLIITIKRIKRT